MNVVAMPKQPTLSWKEVRLLANAFEQKLMSIAENDYETAHAMMPRLLELRMWQSRMRRAVERQT